jgi:hypothetical protein
MASRGFGRAGNKGFSIEIASSIYTELLSRRTEAGAKALELKWDAFEVMQSKALMLVQKHM